MQRNIRPVIIALAASACAAWAVSTHAASVHATPGQVLAEYTRQAGAGGDPARGQALLSRLEAGATPLELQLDAPIDHDRLEAWFLRRCRATLQRPCSSLEKADMAAALLREQQQR